MKKIILLMIALYATATNAQIVYTDVNPDSTVTTIPPFISGSFYVDLNNNGSYEFELRHFNPPGVLPDIELQQNPDSDQQVMMGADNRSLALVAGDSVGPGSVQWGNTGWLKNTWYGTGDRYFGFRFQIAGAWHYGWARLSIPANLSSFTIKDYAYNATPGQRIICGSTTTRIKKRESIAMILAPNPVQDELTVFIPEVRGSLMLSIATIAGKKVLNHWINDASQPAKINVQSLPAGTYVVSGLTSNGKIIQGRKMTIGRI